MFTAISPARAASVGNPKTQGQGKLEAAAEWSHVFDRKLQFESATRPAGHEADEPKNFEINNGYEAAGKISCGVFDTLDVYIKLGVSGYDANGDVFAANARAVTEKLTANAAFLYGGGLKFAYGLENDWVVGADAQYLASNHRLDFNAANTTTGVITAATYESCPIRQWHIAPYVAGKIAGFTPYAGVQYSDLKLEQKKPDDPKRWDNVKFKAANNIGIFAGTDYAAGASFKVNIEANFIDETAITAGASYKF